MIDVISPAPREEWRAVIAGDPQALPEHAPEWTDALCAAGPYADASRLYTADRRPPVRAAAGASHRAARARAAGCRPTHRAGGSADWSAAGSTPTRSTEVLADLRRDR